MNEYWAKLAAAMRAGLPDPPATNEPMPDLAPSPDLLKTIKQAFNPLHLSSTEVSLIKHLRELSGNQQCGPIVFPGHKIIALIAA